MLLQNGLHSTFWTGCVWTSEVFPDTHSSIWLLAKCWPLVCNCATHYSITVKLSWQQYCFNCCKLVTYCMQAYHSRRCVNYTFWHNVWILSCAQTARDLRYSLPEEKLQATNGNSANIKMFAGMENLTAQENLSIIGYEQLIKLVCRAFYVCIFFKKKLYDS